MEFILETANTEVFSQHEKQSTCGMHGQQCQRKFIFHDNIIHMPAPIFFFSNQQITCRKPSQLLKHLVQIVQGQRMLLWANKHFAVYSESLCAYFHGKNMGILLVWLLYKTSKAPISC